MSVFRLITLGCLLAFTSVAQAIEFVVEHQLNVRLNPESHGLTVEDRITLPANAQRELFFSLHAGLKPEIKEDKINLTLLTNPQQGLQQHYKIELPAQLNSFTIRYAGKIYHPLESYGKEQARGFRSTPGLIANEGVFLSATSHWYPRFDDYEYMKFNMRVEAPDGWKTVSQGKRTQVTNNKGNKVENWDSQSPQEEIYLIAAPFSEYQRKTGDVNALVFLRQPDEKLANKYLDATTKYVSMFEKLLGEYPYSKFALVENFWETGYGMPSFTLLGSKVIRLPFIINSSYPHEILHNWWGNGVYVDFASGNWSEGLTAYLADHLIKEQQGQAANYRLQSLQKYTDYAAKARDFPLTQFRGRHSSASEAVGYGKTLMLFNMLRQKIGDELFSQSLQKFYRDYKFRIASFDDIQKAFEEISQTKLEQFFKQWTHRTGAADLKLGHSSVQKHQNNYQLSFELKQAQAGEAYHLRIPVAVTLEGKKKARQSFVDMTHKIQQFELNFDSHPIRLDIDPEFDLFRKLATAETPAAFTKLFGSQHMLVVLPRSAKPALKTAWQNFADDLTRMGPDQVDIKWDDQLDALPQDMAVTVLGWNNRFADELTASLSDFNVSVKAKSLQFSQTEISRENHAIAFTTRYPDNGNYARAFIATDLADALPGLGRKLPHYHKYSYLAFSGTEPQNVLKGRWAVNNSPMTQLFDSSAKRGVLKKRSALVQPESGFNANTMLQTIHFLSDKKLAGRGFGEPGLDKAADFIASAFQQAGLKPAGDTTDSYFQHWTEKAGQPQKEAILKNIIGVIPGHHPVRKHESVVLGAHYDHLGSGWPDVRSGNAGKIHYGADDNASGVAVLLDLATKLGRNMKPDRTIMFVAFSGEEAGRSGSRHFVQYHKQYPANKSIGMLNLDTVGRLGNNKVLVLGGNSASEWVHIFRGIGFVTGIPISMVSENLDASDQVSFHEAGIPAVQLFSGVNMDYHRPGDTADKIDSEGLVKIATISQQVIEYLAAREQPLTSQLSSSDTSNRTQPATSRKVSLGSIPDFTFNGDGYRLDGVTPDSPAANAGLLKGDIIIKLNDFEIHGLRDISKALKTMLPGQTISISYQRLGKTLTTQATLQVK